MNRRAHIVIRGAVQGVGFRPFIYRAATDLGITGWVSNSQQGVFIEAEADVEVLKEFLLRVHHEKPAHAFIQSLECSHLDPVGYTGFEIRTSAAEGPPEAFVLPDIATCPDCLEELFDPADRRYRYPFINCTNCGPRFSIIETLPYDRPRTTMKAFPMCDQCNREYTDPRNRRFHAQPNACPVCGPSLELWDGDGRPLERQDAALRAAADLLRQGKTVAVKGVGGFHLMTDACNDGAVRRLRERKHREEKPFAMMFPSTDMVSEEAILTPLEARLLESAEAPIVLLQRKVPGGTGHGNQHTRRLAPSIAPGNPYLGTMIPSAPLHHLLMGEIGGPVVATSGNISDEPICIDEREALRRLGGIADAFLVHNRPIVRHIDDSIVRVMMDRELVLRRARGYAPLPLPLPTPVPDLLAVGAHLKSTVAAARGNQVFISQHLGDLETEESYRAFERETRSLQELYRISPTQVVSDAHPDYLSTAFARETGLPLHLVQHHYAHVTSCMADNALEGTVLGVSWDGTGFGPDGTVWGGEFLLTSPTGFRRVATLRQFKLPGADQAVREPRRSAFGLLCELFRSSLTDREDLNPVAEFTRPERVVLGRMVARGINSPATSSVGRLFDAVASITGLRQVNSFEGQAAMEMEFAIPHPGTKDAYKIPLQTSREKEKESVLLLDWEPMIRAVLEDLRQKIAPGIISHKFHNALANSILEVGGRIGERRILLTGGCFQNRYLTERTVTVLSQAGFQPYWHQRIPPNDGGISLGQIYAAARSRAFKRHT
ncbi:MAG: carbamoyltransferase HypF [Bacteroidota bacterium]